MPADILVSELGLFFILSIFLFAWMKFQSVSITGQAAALQDRKLLRPLAFDALLQSNSRFTVCSEGETAASDRVRSFRTCREGLFAVHDASSGLLPSIALL